MHVAFVAFLFLQQGDRIQSCRCQTMRLSLSRKAMILLRLNFANQLPLPFTKRGLLGLLQGDTGFHQSVREDIIGHIFTATKLDLHQILQSSVAVHLVQNVLINHYALVCKHSLMSIAGIKPKQSYNLRNCAANWVTEKTQAVNRYFGVVI